MYNLNTISETVQDIADAIKAAFNVDVEIVDDKIVRVAATSFAKDKIGKKMIYGTISKYVIKNNQPVILNDMEQNFFCKQCQGKGNCGYSGGIIVPINFDNRTIGSINLVTYTQKQLCELLKNQKGLTDFLYKMADLITSKLREKRLYEKEIQTSCELKAIINTVSDGLISIDKKGKIKKINNLASNMLLEEKEKLMGKSINNIFNDIPIKKVLSGEKLSNIELSFNRDNKNYKYIASIKPIMKDENVFGALISLNYYENVKKLAFEFGSSNKRITFKDIICKSNIMRKIIDKALRFAKSDSTVLITGESGTGKELFARAIHSSSNRANNPFITVNCGAIPETLIESELFGYEKGAFTGAISRGKPGKFELANKGTIFLDEIGTMPIYLQAKLLRVLENREIDKVGGSQSIPIDVRILAATNSNLEEMVKQGKFRSDLYYRLNVIPIQIPPLRERKEDILELSYYFIKKYNVLLGKKIECISNAVEQILIEYDWPGNVRELENVIEYAVNLSLLDEEILEEKHIPPYILNNKAPTNNKKDKLGDINNSIISIDEYEKKAISYLLKKIGTSTENKKVIAKKLGISKATLYRKIKKYGLDIKHYIQNEKKS
jgi:transcriptional regulator with PAS, ATPase and Fis domain